jgi:hypothetical protein
MKALHWPIALLFACLAAGCGGSGGGASTNQGLPQNQTPVTPAPIADLSRSATLPGSWSGVWDQSFAITCTGHYQCRQATGGSVTLSIDSTLLMSGTVHTQISHSRQDRSGRVLEWTEAITGDILPAHVSSTTGSVVTTVKYSNGRTRPVSGTFSVVGQNAIRWLGHDLTR